MKLIKIKKLSDFNNIIKNKHVSIIYFYSDLFKNITEKINKFLENIYDVSILFYSVNIDDSLSIVKNDDITTFPILRIYKNSEFIKEIYCSYDELESILLKLYE